MAYYDPHGRQRHPALKRKPNPIEPPSEKMKEAIKSQLKSTPKATDAEIATFAEHRAASRASLAITSSGCGRTRRVGSRLQRANSHKTSRLA